MKLLIICLVISLNAFGDDYKWYSSFKDVKSGEKFLLHEYSKLPQNIEAKNLSTIFNGKYICHQGKELDRGDWKLKSIYCTDKSKNNSNPNIVLKTKCKIKLVDNKRRAWCQPVEVYQDKKILIKMMGML